MFLRLRFVRARSAGPRGNIQLKTVGYEGWGFTGETPGELVGLLSRVGFETLARGQRRTGKGDMHRPF